MRDYYLDYISDHGRKFEKGSSSQGAKGTKESFAPIAPSSESGFPKIGLVKDLAFATETEKDRSIIVEERIAIMMFDGGLSEEEATEYLTNRQKRSFLPAA